MHSRFAFGTRWAVSAVALALTACGGGSGGNSAPPVTTASATLSGTVFAAPVAGSSVSAYAADAQGQQTGAALATATTDAQGGYALTLNSLPAGAVLVVASGGTYTSEADHSTQTLGTMTVLLPSVASGQNAAQISPMTTVIAAATSNLLAASGGTVAAASTTATAKIKSLFGLGALAGDPSATAPDTSASTGDAWLVAALAGTLETLRANTAIKAADLYQALTADAADGNLDGLANGKPIALGTGLLSSSLFTTQWSGAANAWGVAQPQYANATSSISAALQASAQAAGIAIGSSGSIAPLLTQSGGTQLYFAARSDGLVELDMSQPAMPVASKVTAINNAVLGSAPGRLSSIDGIVINPTPINTAAGAKVFAILYSYSSRTVYSVNLTDGVVSDSTTLPIAQTTSFSGASAAIAGGIADGTRGKIWLATGDGLYGIDPSQLQAAPVVIAQPAGTTIDENLGGDPAKGIVFSPDYNNGGLVVFNLAEAKAYQMDAATWSTQVGSWSGLGEIDGAALDSQYNLAVMTLEGGSQIGLLAYAPVSGATTSVGSIPGGAKFMSYDTGAPLSGAAIDPVSHTGLFVGEGGSLGVGTLDDPTHANWQGFTQFASAGYGVSSYQFEPHDPHTVGAFNIAGKPYGFVLQGGYAPYKVVVIDLDAMLAAPATAGTLNSDPMTNPAIVTQLGY
ncbi:MAG: hypothetical protein KGL18_15600 [Burkholderiales bacterium]|nr:hypothetical protein [Burkholderiales bacterium]MDE1927174.1 hypothetical protein [Burkholderiales bacterium]MDE2157815.1 hypothetical protein [Burkholderiales bacterium]MDE2504387.1 hypothetical protein [Burkholderiales bacterium]